MASASWTAASGCFHGEAPARSCTHSVKSHHGDLSRAAPGPHKEVGSRKAGKKVKPCSPTCPSRLRRTGSFVSVAVVTCPRPVEVFSGRSVVLEPAVP